MISEETPHFPSCLQVIVAYFLGAVFFHDKPTLLGLVSLQCLFGRSQGHACLNGCKAMPLHCL